MTGNGVLCGQGMGGEVVKCQFAQVVRGLVMIHGSENFDAANKKGFWFLVLGSWFWLHGLVGGTPHTNL